MKEYLPNYRVPHKVLLSQAMLNFHTSPYSDFMWYPV